MIKFKLYYDKDQEEKFLNTMSERGYAMEKFFLGLYFFEPCNPGEYTYRVDLIAGKDIRETNLFYDLVRDAGGELVQTWGFWAFYRKKEVLTFIPIEIAKLLNMKRLEDYFWV